MAVVRKCNNPQGGVEGIRKVCESIERCDGHGGRCKGTVVKKCDREM